LGAGVSVMPFSLYKRLAQMPVRCYGFFNTQYFKIVENITLEINFSWWGETLP
jgi:hypothetical protein